MVTWPPPKHIACITESTSRVLPTMRTDYSVLLHPLCHSCAKPGGIQAERQRGALLCGSRANSRRRRVRTGGTAIEEHPPVRAGRLLRRTRLVQRLDPLPVCPRAHLLPLYVSPSGRPGRTLLERAHAPRRLRAGAPNPSASAQYASHAAGSRPIPKGSCSCARARNSKR